MYKAVVVCDSKGVIDAFDSVDLWTGTQFTLVETAKNISDIQTKNFDLLVCPTKAIFEKKDKDLAKLEQKNHKYFARIFYGRKSYDHIKIAMDNGGVGYIPIPIEKTNFDMAISNAKKLLANNNQLDVEYEDERELREMFVFKLLSGEIKRPEQLINEYSKLGLDFDITLTNCAFIRVTIENFNEYLRDVWKYGKDTLYNAVNNFIKRNSADICILPFNTVNNDIFVFGIKQKGLSNDKYLSSVKDEIYDLMGIKISYSIIKSYNAIFDLIEPSNIETIAAQTGLSYDLKVEGADKYKTIAAAKNYIINSFSQEICLDDVAEYVSLSSAYFSRLFKQETGENFIDYLIKIRMEQAKNLLETTDKKTYEISEYVGYKKSKYFSKLFKNYTGYTPTEYRTKIKRKKGEND